MKTFLTTAEREFLIEEYKQTLEDMEELEEYGYLLDELRTMNNVDFMQQIVEFMPIFEKPGEIKRRMRQMGCAGYVFTFK